MLPSPECVSVLAWRHQGARPEAPPEQTSSVFRPPPTQPRRPVDLITCEAPRACRRFISHGRNYFPRFFPLLPRLAKFVAKDETAGVGVREDRRQRPAFLVVAEMVEKMANFCFPWEHRVFVDWFSNWKTSSKFLTRKFKKNWVISTAIWKAMRAV